MPMRYDERVSLSLMCNILPGGKKAVIELAGGLYMPCFLVANEEPMPIFRAEGGVRVYYSLDEAIDFLESVRE